MRIPWPVKVGAIAWMAGCVIMYLLVTVHPDGFIGKALPEFVWELRAAVLPLFHSDATVQWQ